MSTKRFITLNIIFSAVIAVVIYFFVRDDYYILFFEDKIIFLAKIRKYLANFINTKLLSGYIIKYSLGDLLWAYALYFPIVFSNRRIIKSVIISIIIIILLESLQFSKFISGNFDPIDIICEIIGILFAAVVFAKFDKKENKILYL